MFKIKEIGIVESKFKEPTNPEKMRKAESTIIITPEYKEGLDKIEDNEYLQILFYLDRSESYVLKGPRRFGEVRGVFASRSPKRPNPIGVTTVKLLERKENKLKIKGLDAIDQTPIIDIKPYSAMMDEMNT